MPHDGQTTGNSFRVRVRLKLEKKSVACVWTFIPVWKWMIWPWLLHPGSRWMPDLLISSDIRSDRRTILGHPRLTECMGICILSLAHGSEQRGSDVICIIIVKNWSGNFSLNSPRVRALGWPLLGIFWGGSLGQIINREYIVFRGSNISCSLACRVTVLTERCAFCFSSRWMFAGRSALYF